MAEDNDLDEVGDEDLKFRPIESRKSKPEVNPIAKKSGRPAAYSSKGTHIPRYVPKHKRPPKDTLQNRLIEAKLREEVAKRKHKEKIHRRKLLRRQLKLQEELEYLHFPTMLGWYFDGFFIHHFAMRQEWADIFNAVEEEFAHKKDIDPEETFTEKVRRNFWPPKIYGSLCFRGRGIYMDFREVIRDPPHTPPETNFEGLREDNLNNDPEAFLSTLDWKGEDEAGNPGGVGHRYNIVGKKFEEINRNDYYFDEEKANWFLRRGVDPYKLYYDQRFKCWRLKRLTIRYAGDWWFDDQNGKFKPKDRNARPYIYKWDPVWMVWKKRQVFGPSSNGLLPKDYYYDELRSEWFLKKGRRGFAFDENGWRAAKRIELPGPDDWWFDEFAGVHVKKDPGAARSYFYDPQYCAWRRVGGLNVRREKLPSDYYFNEQKGMYEKKNAPRPHFIFDLNNKFYRKKRALIGLHNPRNWEWDNNRKLWVPKKPKSKNIFTMVLNWRPERDYDKPWEDYRGFIEYGRPNQPQKAEGGEVKVEGEAGEGNAPSSAFEALTAGSNEVPRKTLDQILKAEWGDEKYSKDPNRIKFGSTSPGFEDGEDEDAGGGAGGEEGEFDKAIDRKRLKCANLNDKFTPKELKAYFASAIAVRPPKSRGPDEPNNFLYIQFESDQAAAAAIRTMHHVHLKGQKLEITYPRRGQK